MTTTTEIRIHNGVPSLFLSRPPSMSDRLMAPIVAYVGPDYVGTFREAGLDLYTFSVPGTWWVGPDTYDFSPIDAFIAAYVAQIPDGFFMPRINLSHQGHPWWGEAHPDEMNILLDIATGGVRDQLAPNPRAVPYLGHEVNLQGINLHSFHSQVWREDAGRAVAALIQHCEAMSYADQVWAWHLCDGLFCEWFHWNEYAFDGLADYAPAAQADFRRWLRRTYRDDPGLLSQAWGRDVTFDTATIPNPQARLRVSHGEFYDPVRDRPTIDYMQCFNDATVDSIIAVYHALKDALPRPKVTCVFYGYQFSDMPRPQLNGHYALARLLASPAVDLIASPHAYSNRGEGGYHAPQAVADAIRRAGKLHFDEIDCKTVWTPASVTWKRHISQPKTVSATVEMMKKDAAYQLASATAQWWMDLTNQGWFDAPEAVAPIRKLKAIEERLQGVARHAFGEVAFVVSQRAMMFQAPKPGLHNAALLFFRNWHLSRMGAPFEQLLMDDLARPDLPTYKLYIMPNAFYLSKAQRALIDRVVKRNGATALWIYAPGYLDDSTASVDNMHALTGIHFGMEDVYAELDVEVTEYQHPLTANLPRGFAYGTGVNREPYMQPPKAAYMPETAVSPAFFAADDAATVLGTARSTQHPGLVYKDLGSTSGLGTWRSIYSAAPLLPWRLLRSIARHAGVHLYDDEGDMLWGNNAFLAVYAQHGGKRTLHFPTAVTVEDAYEGTTLATNVDALTLDMGRWETKLLLMTPTER